MLCPSLNDVTVAFLQSDDSHFEIWLVQLFPSCGRKSTEQAERVAASQIAKHQNVPFIVIVLVEPLGTNWFL